MRVCNVCSNAQPRYKLHPKHINAVLQFKYLAYQQCLPGCVVVNQKLSDNETTLLYDNSFIVPLTNDILCKAYDGNRKDPQKLRNSSSEAPVGNSSDQGKRSGVWFLLDTNDPSG